MRSPPTLLFRSPVAAVLGIALGLAVTLGVLRFIPPRDTPQRPPDQLGGAPLPEEEGPLAEVLFHYLPEIETRLRAPYADFLGTLPASTRLVAIVPRAAGEAPLRHFLDSIDPALFGRTQVVLVEGPISPWSKDRALVLGPDAERSHTTLLTPVQPPKEWERRRNDWHTVGTFASTRSEYSVRKVPLDFDAGDFAVTRKGVLVDANLITKNRSRQISTPEDLERVLEPLLGENVLVLGDRDGDIPRHHLSMYMTPVGQHGGRDVVLVGDPGLARSVVGVDYRPGESDPDSGQELVADFSPTMISRHDRAAAELAKAGFHVVRIPTVPFLDKTYIAYTNSVLGSWGSRRIVWMPTYDIPDLDQRAQSVYEDLGWEVRRVRVRSVYAYHGTIGCLVNVLDRGTTQS